MRHEEIECTKSGRQKRRECSSNSRVIRRMTSWGRLAHELEEVWGGGGEKRRGQKRLALDWYL